MSHQSSSIVVMMRVWFRKHNPTKGNFGKSQACCSILKHFAGIARPKYQERVTLCENKLPHHLYFGILPHLC